MPHRPLQKTFKDVGMVGHDPPTYMEGKAFLLSVLPPLEAWWAPHFCKGLQGPAEDL